MAQDIPRFGFQIAPEISSAERESVSTDPNSSLQRAIRSTQQSTEFHTPKELLLRGPQAFRIAAQAEQERRNMLTSRAQQGINLSNIAISHRVNQRKYDARAREENILSRFIERTSGMDTEEALSSMGPEEASSPLTVDFLRQRDALDVIRSASPQREVDKRKAEAFLSVPQEDLEQQAKMDSVLTLKKFSNAMRELSQADPANPDNYLSFLAELDFESDDVALGFHRRIQENPEEAASSARFLGDMAGQISEAEAILGSESANKARNALGALTAGFASGGELDATTKYKMLKEVSSLSRSMREVEAKKEALNYQRAEAYRDLAYANAAAAAQKALGGGAERETYEDWLKKTSGLLLNASRAKDLSVKEEKIPKADILILPKKAREVEMERLLNEGYVSDGDFYVKEIENPVWAEVYENITNLAKDLSKRSPGEKISDEDLERIERVTNPPPASSLQDPSSKAAIPSEQPVERRALDAVMSNL